MQKFANELVTMKPDVILSFGTPVPAALHRETQAVPVVFAIVSDPVGEGFVVSLAHPGGNVTGFHNSEDQLEGNGLNFLRRSRRASCALR
jgi:ABC-type uncharacterized transport system substrate-binding protein